MYKLKQIEAALKLLDQSMVNYQKQQESWILREKLCNPGKIKEEMSHFSK